MKFISISKNTDSQRTKKLLWRWQKRRCALKSARNSGAAEESATMRDHDRDDDDGNCVFDVSTDLKLRQIKKIATKCSIVLKYFFTFIDLKKKLFIPNYYLRANLNFKNLFFDRLLVIYLPVVNMCVGWLESKFLNQIDGESEFFF